MKFWENQAEDNEKEDEESEQDKVSRRKFGKTIGLGAAGLGAVMLGGNAAAATTIDPDFISTDDDDNIYIGADNDYSFTYNSSFDRLELLNSSSNPIFSIGSGNILNMQDNSILLGGNALQFKGQTEAYLTNHQRNDPTSGVGGGVNEAEISHQLAINSNSFIKIYSEFDTSGGIMNEEVRIFQPTNLNQNKLENVGRPTNSVSSDYTTSTESSIYVDVSSNTVTVTLASADAFEGNRIRIADVNGNASNNNITINTEGGETINGESSAVINSNYEALELESDGSNWIITGRMAGGSVN
jgi:hypothetical protein